MPDGELKKNNNWNNYHLNGNPKTCLASYGVCQAVSLVIYLSIWELFQTFKLCPIQPWKTLQKHHMLVLIGQGPLAVVRIYDSCQSGAKVEVAWHCYWGLKTAWRGALGGFGVQQHGTLTPKTTVKFDPQPRQGRGADIVLELGLNRKHCVHIFPTTLSRCLCSFIV